MEQRQIIFSNRFVKEYSLMLKRGKDSNKIKTIIRLLEIGESIPPKYRDHKLDGEYRGSRELHIEPDWLLIYQILGNELILERTGTHSDLFR